ncbi:MAG: MATE family efflux transporter [Planctomycetes bacterium]|nr:MATE family efflux transporter [Planctomycetota bacterium]
MSAQSQRFDKSQAYLGSQPISKLIIRFALPCVVAMLVNAAYNIVDQFFIGRGIGYLGNGATNVVFPITVLALGLALLLGDGAAAFFSIKMGEGKSDVARKGVITAIAGTAVAGIVLTVFAVLFLDKLLVFFGATDSLLPYAKEYGGVIILGFPFVIMGTGMNPLVRADGSPGYAMRTMIYGAVLNTILDPIFIFTFGMGVRGAAIATVISQGLVFCLNLRYMARRHRIFQRGGVRPEMKLLSTIASLGISSFIVQIAATTVIIMVNRALVAYGSESVYGAEIPLTVLGIVMKVNQIVFSIMLGIAVGAQPIIGYNYGAGKLDRVKKTYFTAAGLATCVAVLAFIAYMLFPGQIIDLFGTENEMYRSFAILCFRVNLFFTFLIGFQVCTGIFFQSIAKPLQSALISLSRQFGFMIPSLLILPRFYGVEGILLAGPVSDILSFIMALILIIRQLRHLKAPDDSDSDPQSIANPPLVEPAPTSASARWTV